MLILPPPSTTTLQICAFKGTTAQFGCVVDLVFVVDRSSSINAQEWTQAVGFVLGFTNQVRMKE
jgi:hypothetical protein